MIINLTNIDLDYLDVDPTTNEIPRITEKWASTLGDKQNKNYTYFNNTLLKVLPSVFQQLVQVFSLQHSWTISGKG